MHMQYKIGLFLYLIIILSKHFTNGAPSKNQSSAYYEDDYDDYKDYYEANETDAKDFKLENEHSPTATTTTTTTRSPLFNRKTIFAEMPKRTNHIIEPKCPTSCSCMEDFKYIKCSYSNLTQIPHDIPNTAHIIDLSHNHITTIDAIVFSNFTKVLEIRLNDNRIKDIDKDSFSGMKHLKRLFLGNNQLTTLHPDTFASAKELVTLDLSNNSIVLPSEGSFLNQPNLVELDCTNCSWTRLYDDSFANMSLLTTLKLDGNDFQKKINTKAFKPLRFLLKLKLADLDERSIQELCSLLKSIDKINFKHFDVTCLELVLGYSFNESLTVATETPPIQNKTEQNQSETETKDTKRIKDNSNITIATIQGIKKMNESESNNNNMTLVELPTESVPAVESQTPNVLTAGINVDYSNVQNVDNSEEEKTYQVPVSEETINIMLISIMIIALIGLIVGIICRKDIGGIKTKCCRTKKNTTKDPEQEQTPEEIPLNKLGN